jgi:hypothetical protein
MLTKCAVQEAKSPVKNLVHIYIYDISRLRVNLVKILEEWSRLVKDKTQKGSLG